MSFELADLPPRLAAVLELVPEGSVVADVGSGHGLLALHLVAAGRAARVVAIDRSTAEIEAAVRFPGVEWRLGDGLAPLTPADGVDTIVIAGMGGRSAAAILARSRGAMAPRRVIVQAQTEVGALRGALGVLGFRVIEERLVFDRGRFYTIVAATTRGDGQEPPPPAGLTGDDVLEAGPCLLRDRPPELALYWRRQVERLSRIAPEGEALARARRILSLVEVETR